MRPFLLPLASCVLIAQTPDPVALEAKYKAEAPAIEELIKGFKAKEAMDKAATLVPNPKPAFDFANLATVQKSFDANRVIINMHLLQQKAAKFAGEWEKQQQVLETTLAIATENKANLLKGVDPVQKMWAKATQDGQAYAAANQAKVPELQQKLAKLQTDVDEYNAKKRTFTKEEVADLQKRHAESAAWAQEAETIKAAMAMHKDNADKGAKVTQFIDLVIKDADQDIARLNKALEDVKKDIAGQAQEIKDFNEAQLKKNKKFKADGAKQWVEAILNKKENVTQYPTPQLQALFVNRLLVLDPTSKKAAAVMDNLKAGRDPFFVEKPAKKGAKK